MQVVVDGKLENRAAYLEERKAVPRKWRSGWVFERIVAAVRGKDTFWG